MAEFIDAKRVSVHNGGGIGTRIGPGPEIHGTDGFDAFGKEVPMHRRSNALKHMRDMGCANTEANTLCIDKMCNAIRKDEPYDAVKFGMQHLDLTGTYRLLAVLCTG